ncbi:MAG: DUF1810 family protein [Bacteroidaceae bacterium]
MIGESQYDLGRFVRAQGYQHVGYADALQEVKEGCKRGHWIWYVFPQIKGLGLSDYSEFYGIGSMDEARAYMRHPVLGMRLREISEVLLQVGGRSMTDIFGGIDAMKVRSCMTLFDMVAPHDVFERVLEECFRGERCKLTLKRFGTADGMNVRMLGALVGDIVGSVYEFNNTKSVDFELFTPSSNFTDDSVMTLAVAKWLMEDECHSMQGLVECMQELGREHPNAGYGGRFRGWLEAYEPLPYNSWGNGSGMRVSPVGLYAKTLDEALALAAVSAAVTHNHPEGVKGAQAIAASVFLCKEGLSKEQIRYYVERVFGYRLRRKIADIRPAYSFDVSCQGSVPEAIIAFLEGNDFEEVIRLAVSLGGDSDTIACMAGAIAACKYSIPNEMAERCDEILTNDLRKIKDDFMRLLDGR